MRVDDTMLDPWVRLAILETKNTFGHDVSVVEKRKSLLKFGSTANADDGVNTTVMQLQGDQRHEAYVTTNLIDSISSADAGDDQVIRLECHTIDGNGNLTFLVQTVTLNGQTRVALPTAVARVSRAEVNPGTFASPTSVPTGPIYVYENTAITAGAPNDASKTHILIGAGETKSKKCATSFSQYDYFFVTGAAASVTRQTTSNVDLFFEVKPVGGVFAPQAEISLRTAGQSSIEYQFKPYLIIPANADVRITCTASAANTEVAAFFQGVIAIRI